MSIKNSPEKIDWNEQSLFTTPLGRTLQQYKMEILLGRVKKASEFANYIENVDDEVYNISRTFWDLDLTLKLINFADPKVKSFKMTRVDRGDYLRYHLENYFFRLPKLKDQVLHLLNQIYRMGFSGSFGLEKKIRTHSRIKDNKYFHYLDYFDYAFEKIKPIRNSIAHRHELKDWNLALLSLKDVGILDENQYQMRVQLAINNTIPLEENQGSLKQAIITLLMMLEEDFNIELEKISKSSNT